MVKIECTYRVCQRIVKVSKLRFIETSDNVGLQVEVHLKCGHMAVYQVRRVPVGCLKL